MKVNRFKKAPYTTIDKSKLHQFLKEEGFIRAGLALDLEVTVCTIDRYMDNPHKIKVEHIKRIMQETGVDANFIFDLIYDY
ncbi:MAG: hypothetical protein Unbinned4264contig1000_6 [Prokaryotic dsDNA virus sp.]|nr:MAG: hypothetical protein Unbinned4264contig1000_6 [Prokaryotic dsDNA virus sp.]